MQMPLYFHVRHEDVIQEHTYCVDKCQDALVVGYSVVNKGDQFNKKRGRDIARGRMAMIRDTPLKATLDGAIHPVINATLDEVLSHAGNLLGLKGTQKAIICGHFKPANKRASIIRSFEVVE